MKNQIILKAILIIQLISLLTINCYSQADIIINGDETESKVFKIGNTIPKSEFAFQDGLTINNNLYDFSKMVNGNDLFEYYSDHKTGRSGKTNWNTKGNYFTLGLGVGNSYGGYGLRCQYVIDRTAKIGIHAGAGLMTSMGSSKYILLSSIGVQYYLRPNLYADIQFSSFGEGYTFSDCEGVSPIMRIYGPGILLGYDWFFTEQFGLNAGAGASLDLSAFKTGINVSFDLGLLFKFK